MLDVKSASLLQQQLLERRGAPIAIDGSRVERLGGLCLQVLLAARSSWAADRQAFHFDDPSPELQAVLSAFGVAVPALTFREE